MLKKLIYKVDKIHGYVTGVKNYGKFVVITRSRTGSNLLISLLDSHPNIHAFGEMFNRIEDKSCKEIYDEIFPKKSNKTIGFKIFYYHPADSDDSSIWDILKNDKSFKIIHLQRENVLRVHISRLIAGNTDVWSRTKNESIDLDQKKVHVDIDALFKDIEVTNRYINKINSDFKNHKVLKITYESIVKNSNKSIADAFEFLGVSKMNAKSELKKQNPEKIKYLVTNYHELKEKLANSEFSYMLEE